VEAIMHRNALLVLVCLLAAAAAPAAALAGGGAVRQDLSYPARGDCSIGGAGEFTLGYVILNRADDRVSALIALRGAPPNGRWQIELDQTPLMGCSNFEGVIATNGQGNGTVHVSEALAPGNTGAFVRLDPLNDAAQATGIVASPGAELPR
jgi:hypothetical protein